MEAADGRAVEGGYRAAVGCEHAADLMVAALGDEESGGAGGRDGQRGWAAGFGFAAEDEGTRGEDGGEVLGEIVIDGDFVRLGGFVARGSPAVDEGAVVA